MGDYLIPICAVVFAGAVVALGIHNTNQEWAKRDATTKSWLASNGCKRTGYTGRTEVPIYTCRDGWSYSYLTAERIANHYGD